MTITKAKPKKVVVKKPSSSDPTVKTYKVLKTISTEDGHKRLPGDYIHEALGWRNPGVWEKSRHIEICYARQSELDEWQADYEARCAAEDAAAAAEASQAAEEKSESERQEKEAPDKLVVESVDDEVRKPKKKVVRKVARK